ncbi:hypothetical protein DFH06DRAFT_1141677, partial [Mycena polygramma]
MWDGSPVQCQGQWQRSGGGSERGAGMMGGGAALDRHRSRKRHRIKAPSNAAQESPRSVDKAAKTLHPPHDISKPRIRLIFSDLTILPPGRDTIPALHRLADVLSTSPHLALHVRTLHLVQPDIYQPGVWMKSDTVLPAILSKFTSLQTLEVQIYNWDPEYLHEACEQAIYALIPSLSSIELKEARMRSSGMLVPLLRDLPASLRSASFWNVFATDRWPWSDDDESESIPARLQLVSLQLNSYAPALFDWAIQAVDLNCLRSLHTLFDEEMMSVIQELIDGAVCVETYHLSFKSVFSHDESPNLEKMQGLRTLEITVRLDWDEIVEVEGEGRHNPLEDAMRSLDTAPHTVEHLILNLEMWNPDYLYHFTDIAQLQQLGEDWPALRDVV